MMSLGPLGFAAPWVLAGAIALPVIWWLLRVTPPAPRRQVFPPLRLLKGLGGHEEAAARTPWWLVVLRLLAALLLLLGLARPVWSPQGAPPSTSRPLLLVIDDGWAAAAHWEALRAVALGLLDRAARDGRSVRLLTTAPDAEGGAPRLGPPETAAAIRERLLPLEPKPWPTAPDDAARALTAGPAGGSAEAVWLSNGLQQAGTRDLMEHLQRRGGLTVLTPPPGNAPLVLLPPERTSDGLRVTLRRPAGDATDPTPPQILPPRSLTVRALDTQGRPVGAVPVSLAAGAAEASVVLPLPPDLRNSLARLEAAPLSGGRTGAAAVALLADQWRRPPAGIVTSSDAGDVPLLDESYYLDKALAETADIKRGTLGDLLDQRVAVLFAPDGSLPGTPPKRLIDWVEAGGVLVRFAGPALADAQARARTPDGLLPVSIRGGGRTLGGVLSWSEPAGLADFPDDSPFAGLTVPADVTVRAQVLAEPSPTLSDRTWARLKDGTPLVTGAPRGQGWTVLVHTTANAAWTDLPLSGLFPHLLDRLAQLSQGADAVAGDARAAGLPRPPREVLDGFGHLVPAPPTVRPLPPGALEDGRAVQLIGPAHPPGFYGRDGLRGALNLASHPAVAQPRALTSLPAGVTQRPLEAAGTDHDLGPWLLITALMLLLADTLLSFALRGLLPLPRGPRAARRAAGLSLLVLAALGAPALMGRGHAQDPLPAVDERAVTASLNPRLAYVETRLPEIDDLSAAGLRTLTNVLSRRSSAELAAPLGLDVNRDDLHVYPLIYWPAANGQSLPGAAVRLKVSRYLDNGGLILFDGRGREGADALRALLRALEIPPLTPLPDDHVLNRAFYLLNGLPGRVDGGAVWIGSQAAGLEGVSPVIIGSNDWAGAWARDERDRPLLPVIEGGEPGREMAYRAGVNMVMYALTGTYKADQVHLPAIMERLTQ